MVGLSLADIHLCAGLSLSGVVFAAKGCCLCQITPQKARKFANNFVVSGEKAYFAFHKT